MKTLVSLFFMLPVISLGQGVSIDFEDHSLEHWFQKTTNHWCVSDNEAIGGSYSLAHCHDDSVAGTDWIAYFHDPLFPGNAERSWEFNIKYNHSPSSSNYWAVCFADNCLPDEQGMISDGVILGVNVAGNSDELLLWKADHGSLNELFNTGFNWEESVPSGKPVCVRVVQSIDNRISIDLDTSGTAFVNHGSVYFGQPLTANIFLLYYKYTANYDRGLFLDDLTIGGNFSADNVSPFVQRIKVNDARNIEIEFSEPVQTTIDAEWCVDDIGCGISEISISNNFKIILPAPLLPGHTFTLHIPGVADVYGNFLRDEDRTIHFFYPRVYDVLITEIMADPSPPVLLPDAEYIELFNLSREEISLDGWTISINSSAVCLPQAMLKGRSHALICDQDFMQSFDTSLAIIPLPDMPPLANAGAEIILQDRSGRLIHSVHYNDDWYSDALKDDGGWSIEMINPGDPCSGKTNWSTSIDYRGGSPGIQNSILDLKSDNSPPELWRSAVSDSGTLVLYFSEPLDSASASVPNYYSVDHVIGNPRQVDISWPAANKIELAFDLPFLAGEEYEVSITSDLCDCTSNMIVPSNNTTFIKPSLPDSGDLVINEIMFDPVENRIEFIELFNRSLKTIDLRECMLMINDGDSNTITHEYWPLLPETYAIIASDYSRIDDEGLFHQAARIIFMSSMPVLPNTGGRIKLFWYDGNILDAVRYSPDLHHAILSENKGVSLERISPEKSGLSEENWHSASSDAGYMTPAASNSQWTSEATEAEIFITPESITPNDDGADEVLSVCYRMDKIGYMALIMVFDAEGRKKYSIANGTLLGTEGCYTFDGNDQTGNVLSTGYYVLYFEAYHAEGERHVFKKAFVVAR